VTDFFRGKRVLVTGSSGFVGRALWGRLATLGADVRGIDWNAHPDAERDKHTFALDVRLWDELRLAFGTFGPEVVFHLAAQAEVLKSYSDPLCTYSVNVGGTLNVLEVCRTHGVRSLVVASSDKAYGYRERHSLPYLETDALTASRDPYGASKCHADMLAQEYACTHGLPLRVVRCANTYGPGQANETTLVTGTVARLLRGERPVVHQGYEDAVREWLFIDDAVEAYLLLAEDAATRTLPKQHYQGAPAFNVGSGVTRSVKEVVAGILEAFRREPGDYTLTPSEGTPQVHEQWLDSGKFRMRFPGWRPLPFCVGLQRAVAWQREGR
jgi:CDP-glucose 4,6-dehydratase